MERYKLLRGKDSMKWRDIRKENLKNEREHKRMVILETRRNIEETPKPKEEPLKKKKSRLELLKEWKFLKVQKENNEKQRKKLPFYVGKIQTTATGSPKLVMPNLTTTVTRRMVTRSQVKGVKVEKSVLPKPEQDGDQYVFNQLNKMQNKSLIPVQDHSFVLPKAVAALTRLTIPQSPKITKSARKAPKPLWEMIPMKQLTSNQCLNDISGPKKSRSNLVFSSEAKLEGLVKTDKENEAQKIENLEAVGMEVSSTSMPAQAEGSSGNDSHAIPIRPIPRFEHLIYSPSIMKTRGSGLKDRASTRMLSLAEKIDQEIEEEDTIFRSKIASFRLFLLNETDRLLKLSEEWGNYLYGNSDTPTDVEGDIRAVVGKTKLLTSDKFKQFKSLIDKCEGRDPLIKVEDLQGFHDWVSLEVEDLDKEFFRLKERKKNNWAPGLPLPAIKKPSKLVKNIIKKPTTGPSSMRAVIMAARKKLQEQKKGSPEKMEPSQLSPVHKSHFHAQCSSTPRDISTLRQRVLQHCSGLEMLAATTQARSSLSPKSPKCLPDINVSSDVTLTPARSILRPTLAFHPSTQKNVAFGLDPKYFAPSVDLSSDDSPEILRLIEPPTPIRRSERLLTKSPDLRLTKPATPIRRSERLLRKSVEKFK